MTINPFPGDRSVLAHLRALVPQRPLQFTETLRIAELQANRLLALFGVTDGPVPNELAEAMPRIRVSYRDLLTSGMSFWDSQSWVICLNRAEPATRQRFTLFHELKHIIDHGHTAHQYRGTDLADAERLAEQAADYFAGCLLMPKTLVKRAWGEGTQRPTALAAQFNVSTRAAEVRLAQLGLSEPRSRCTPPRASYQRARPGTYLRQSGLRQLPAHQPTHRLEGAAA